MGFREGKTAVKAEVKRLLIQLNALREERKVIESEIGGCLKELPGAGLLLTIPRIWSVDSGRDPGAHGDLRNYKHPDHLEMAD